MLPVCYVGTWLSMYLTDSVTTMMGTKRSVFNYPVCLSTLSLMPRESDLVILAKIIDQMSVLYFLLKVWTWNIAQIWFMWCKSILRKPYYIRKWKKISDRLTYVVFEDFYKPEAKKCIRHRKVHRLWKQRGVVSAYKCRTLWKQVEKTSLQGLSENVQAEETHLVSHDRSPLLCNQKCHKESHTERSHASITITVLRYQAATGSSIECCTFIFYVSLEGRIDHDIFSQAFSKKCG